MKVTIVVIAFFGSLALATPKVSHIRRRSGRIINGDVAKPHSFPYQALLEGSNILDQHWYCGGTLIKRNVVLTSGQCLYAIAGPVKITLGAQNALENEDTQVVLSSSNIIMHPNFDVVRILNDIALIILPQEVTLNNYIKLVSLPENDINDYIGQIATVSGWGHTDTQGTTLSDQLRFTQNPVISNQDCRNRYGHIEPFQVCISETGGRSACDGDRGGPLTIDGVQIGIVSYYGIFDCESDLPSVFTRTGSFLNWIKDNLP